MGQLEHIKPILKRVFESLEREGKNQGEGKKIEGKDQEHNITVN